MSPTMVLKYLLTMISSVVLWNLLLSRKKSTHESLLLYTCNNPGIFAMMGAEMEDRFYCDGSTGINNRICIGYHISIGRTSL